MNQQGSGGFGHFLSQAFDYFVDLHHQAVRDIQTIFFSLFSRSRSEVPDFSSGDGQEGSPEEIFRDESINWIRNLIFDFYKAVNWSEPFILGLMAFHALMILAIVFTRKRTNIQGILLLICGMNWEIRDFQFFKNRNGSKWNAVNKKWNAKKKKKKMSLKQLSCAFFPQLWTNLLTIIGEAFRPKIISITTGFFLQSFSAARFSFIRS